jgi:hypothetical protein
MLQLLIDGHNLIGALPGLSLADFDDEQQLVDLLRRFAVRRQARIVVVFDSGNVGGRSRDLSSSGVEVIFAGSHTIADSILVERIREVKRPQDWTLVSSDRAIRQAAERRRMRAVQATDFARQLIPPSPVKPLPDDKPQPGSDIDEWLDVFRRR